MASSLRGRYNGLPMTRFSRFIPPEFTTTQDQETSPLERITKFALPAIVAIATLTSAILFLLEKAPLIAWALIGVAILLITLAGLPYLKRLYRWGTRAIRTRLAERSLSHRSAFPS